MQNLVRKEEYANIFAYMCKEKPRKDNVEFSGISDL